MSDFLDATSAARATRRRRRDTATAWAMALLLHMIAAVALLGAQAHWGPSEPSIVERGHQQLALRLVPPPEQEIGLLMPSARPSKTKGGAAKNPSESPPPLVPPLPSPTPLALASLATPRPSPTPPPVVTPPPGPPKLMLDAEARRELERDRQQALAELERVHQEGENDADRALGKVREEMEARNAKSPNSNGGPSPNSSAAPRAISVGTIRQLDLSGYPEFSVQRVMQRYGLRISERALAGGVSQSFLSSASTSDGGQFVADRSGGAGSDPPGIYQVFLLSPRAVAYMSKLEEDELAHRNLDPMKTRVIRVKFGLIGPTGEPDLGITLFEAEPVE